MNDQHELRRIIDEVAANSFKEEFTVLTGHGGAKSFIKAFIVQSGLEVNLANFIKTYKMLRKEGFITTFKVSKNDDDAPSSCPPPQLSPD